VRPKSPEMLRSHSCSFAVTSFRRAVMASMVETQVNDADKGVYGTEANHYPVAREVSRVVERAQGVDRSSSNEPKVSLVGRHLRRGPFR